MEKRLTHLKLRRAIKNNKKLIMTGIYQPGTLHKNMSDEAYHESRAAMYDMYPEAKSIFKFVADMTERKTYNPTYPLSVLKHLIEEKCGEELVDGVVIATMLARGFKCNLDIRDPLFNVSSASPALQ